MSPPVLFVIDDDPGVVCALHDDLSRRFGGDFRVAVGDARYRSIKRVASAVGDGATAVRLTQEYLALPPADRAAARSTHRDGAFTVDFRASAVIG